MKETRRAGQPFDEERHKHLADHLPTVCWSLRLYAGDIATTYSNHAGRQDLARVARAAADLAGELLAGMEAASREEFPAATWLEKYHAPQPPDLSKVVGELLAHMEADRAEKHHAPTPPNISKKKQRKRRSRK